MSAMTNINIIVGCILLLLALICISSVSGDQNYYVNSDASSRSDDSLELDKLPGAMLDITTSKTYLAGSSSPIYLYLVGEFSVSGPHPVGPFNDGSRVVVPIDLNRRIGELVGVEFQAGGTDGWLLQRLNIQIGNTVYLMEGPRQWLDRIDPNNERQYRTDVDSWEPLQSDDPSSIPIFSKLKLKVKDTYFDYNSDKIKPWVGK